MNLITPAAHHAANVKRMVASVMEAENYVIRETPRASVVEVVKIKTGEVYRVTESTCTCPDAAHRPGLTCKHRHLASSHFARPEVKAAASAQARRDRVELW